MKENNDCRADLKMDVTDAKVSNQGESHQIPQYLEHEIVRAESTEIKKNLDLEKKSPSNVYKMKSMPRGFAMIINNGAFQPKSGFKPRHGSDVDVKNLENLFQNLGFTVVLELDQGKDQIMKHIDKFRKLFNETPVDMCVFCIMSHGLDGDIVDIHGEEIDVEEEIIKKFYNTECPALQGIPKLFLLQYCRGEELDAGVEKLEKLRKVDINFSSPLKKLPAVTDILIANSTVPGFVSNRNIQHGTWFFQCFIKVFKEHARDTDIRDMFDKMAMMLNEKESNDAGRRKQTFEVVNRGFYKKLFLNPPEEVEHDHDSTHEEFDATDSDKKENTKLGSRRRIKEAWKC